ncbi:MAG: hypothetical protein LUF02_04415 [Erysipelotrichaceae bacterium]|nr:hypothetical protein [Erysipelotrichaceae bacterium]
MEAKVVCYCILLLSGAFALLSLGLLLIRLAGAVKEVTVIVTMLETTVDKVNVILDDDQKKLEILDAPFELIDRIFSGGWGPNLGFFSKRKRKK